MGIFWVDEPDIIYKKYNEFFPVDNMNLEEKMNATTRFCIYYIIILLILRKSINYIIIPLIIIILIIIYNYYLKRKRENMTIDAPNGVTDKYGNDMIVDTAYYDSDNNLRFKQAERNNPKPPNYVTDNITFINDKKCAKPTVDNPYINPNVYDYKYDSVPMPCNVDDSEINVEMKKCFDADLYKNLDDIYDKKNSERQFYTVPRENFKGNNIDFAHYLYHDTGGCRGPDQKCNRYEDLRFSTLQL